MLDTAIKALFVLISSPLWLPLLKSLKQQFEELAEREQPNPSRSWSARPEAPRITENVDLVEEPLAAPRSGRAGFASEPRPEAKGGASLRRAS